jgi:hypothetical protein
MKVSRGIAVGIGMGRIRGITLAVVVSLVVKSMPIEILKQNA